MRRRTEALDDILQRQPVWRGGALARAVEALPSGFAALDAELPGGGWPRHGLTEILADEPGVGELELILPALAALTGAGKRVVWVAPAYIPYAPALAAAGIDLVNLLVVAPPSRRDALWTAEQALRSGSCHALAAWFKKPRYAELQRLAVAAEASHAVAFLFRPLAAAAESSPACLRLALEPAGAELGVHLVKRRGAPLAAPLYLPLKRPFHVLGRAALSRLAERDARAARLLGLPVHA
jgi:cell division inhibitor SulA/protein ImuA